jgi:replication-associated recombination protein RarA
MHLPSQYHCQSVHDFIGPARAVAAHLEKKVRLTAAQRPAMSYFLTGPSGVGKSDLALYLASLLGATKWTIYRKNGTSFRKEDVEEWSRVMHLKEMFGYRVFQVEEADAASKDAQIALLTMLDDMPAGNAFIATTNKPLKDFEARLQRRYAFFEVQAPALQEIAQFLVQRFGVAARMAEAFARGAVLGGNVGQALKDAEEWLISVADEIAA